MGEQVGRAVVAVAQVELALTREALRQLYQFVVEELDPHPAPVGYYLAGPEVQAAAGRAVGGADLPAPDPDAAGFYRGT